MSIEGRRQSHSRRLCSVVYAVFTMGCASHDDEFDSESHFSCQGDLDCATHDERTEWVAGVCRAPRAGEGSGGSSASTDAEGDAAGAEGSHAVGPSDWPMLGYDPASTYLNRRERTIQKGNAGNLRIDWTKDLGSNIYAAPALIGDRMFVAGEFVMALDAGTGETVWQSDISTTASLAYDDGVVYVHDGFAVLHALDAQTGAELWQTALSEHPGSAGFSSPIVAAGRVFIGGSTSEEVASGAPTFRGYVVAVDQRTGEIVWNTYTVPDWGTGASVWSTVSVDVGAGRVFATTGNNFSPPATDTSDAFLAFDVDSGAYIWKSQRLADDVWSSFFSGGPDFDIGANPVLFEAEVDGTPTALVAAGQKSGDFHVLRRDSGALLWTRKLGPGNAQGSAGIHHNTTWSGSHLLVGVNGATSEAPGGEPQAALSTTTAVLFALDGATGDIVWERQLPGEVFSTITVANGVGFVGAGATLQIFDADTGAVLNGFETDATIASTPVVANGRVAFGNGLAWIFGTQGSTLTVLGLP